MIAVFMANGCEEIEALTVVDLCRRAQLTTQMISISNQQAITGVHDIVFLADCLIEEVDFEQIEMIVLPGGKKGAQLLQENELLKQWILAFHDKEKPLAAICAAPGILGQLGILNGKRACSHPTFEDALKGAEISKQEVVCDGNIITSRGMGTAIPFGLAIVEYFTDSETAQKLAQSIVYNDDRLL
ncbi:MAG: DJ-1/PfpI family protein [Lachnospiraceae bacterium]|jgi:4-methyl-5(b-hydroxyethyl)-thiazole monophosphate biosynthesis|nr:DJ-1/PfpI family protein [Lachnospiraceae bacterium]